MKRSAVCLALGLALLLPAPPARASASAAPGPAFTAGCKDCSVILISITNVSANRMSLYGYPRRTTPRLEKWAQAAVTFDDAFAHASWTLPESASILTGLYPFTHGVWKRKFENSLDADVKTLPGILREHGYRTAAFTGGLDYYPGWSQMRDFQTAPSNPNFTGISTTTAQAKEWLKAHAGEKFMLLVQAYDAHCPFQPGGGYKGAFSGPWESTHRVDATRCVRGYKNESTGDFNATYSGGCPQFMSTKDCGSERGQEVKLSQDDVDYLGALYDEVLLQTDSRLADFLESLDPALLRKTIVVVTSDHGEMFAKHGRFGRAGTLRGTHYDDVLHVPLLIRFPDGRGRRLKGLAQHVDLLPTLLDALGIPAPAAAQGKSLGPLIRGGAEVNDYVYSGLSYNFNLADAAKADFMKKTFPFPSVTEAIRDKRWKLIHERRGGSADGGDASELYDIRKDPEELRDLSKSEPDVSAALMAKLKAWSDRSRGAAHASKTEKIPDELLKAARERGYW